MYTAKEIKEYICYFFRGAAKASYRRGKVLGAYPFLINETDVTTRRVARNYPQNGLVISTVFQQSYNREWELLPVDVSKNLKTWRQKWNSKEVEGSSFFRNANAIPCVATSAFFTSSSSSHFPVLIKITYESVIFPRQIFLVYSCRIHVLR